MPGPSTSARQWLEHLGLETYAEAFEANDVDLDVLATLTREDLNDLGVTSVGHRRRLLNAIADLSGERLPDAETGTDAAEVKEPTREPSGPIVAPLAERRNLTILMCDMVRSTELAARSDPEDLRDVLEGFQAACSAAITRFGGYVAKYMGDGVLAYFGYPNALENDAELAIRAGLAIIEKLKKVVPATGEPLAARVGVATGLVVVGDVIGEGSARELSVVGDTPNLAERLQGWAKPGAVLCGSVTRQLAGDLFDYRDLGRHQLKGFDGPIQIWRVLGEAFSESRFDATRLGRTGRMVGRAQEKALLLERWETARRGEGQLVLLSGDSGIGKSRLVSDFMREIDDAQHHRIAFQCLPHLVDSAFAPAIRQLEISAGFKAEDDKDTRRDKLRQLLTELPESLAHIQEFETLLSLNTERPDEENASPEMMRRHFLQALIGRIVAASNDLPTLVVVEDAHWIDPSTTEVVRQLVDQLKPLPMLVVVTFRPEFECPWTDASMATVLKLNRLNRRHSMELANDVFGEQRVPDSLLDQIVERTDGVPLFVEEVSRALLESGAAGSDSVEDVAPDDPAIAVPATLHDTLLSRLDRDEHAKYVAQIASVIGRDFRYSLLESIADLPEDELRRGLDSLVSARLIEPRRDMTDETYGFRHGLLHQATYDTILLRRREALHLAIARALETSHSDVGHQRPEIVASHYRSAGQIARAAEIWLQSGRLALKRGAYDEASRHLRAGLSALSDLKGERERADLELPLQIALAETLRSARLTSGDEALEACRRARALCTMFGDVDQLVRVLRLEFGINFNRPDADAAQWVADEFLVVGKRHNHTVAQMLGHQGSGSLAFFRGELPAARKEFELALALRDPDQERRLVAQFQFPTNSLVYLGMTEFLLGSSEIALKRSQEAIELARRSSPFALSLTLANALLLFAMMRRTEEASEHLETLREIAGARGTAFWADLVGFHDGWLLARSGQPGRALRLMSRALDTFAANAVEIEIPYYTALIAEACVDAGDTQRALDHLDDAMARAQRTGELWCAAELYRIKALAEAPDDHDAAIASLEAGEDVAEGQRAKAWLRRLAQTRLDLARDSSERAAAQERLAVFGQQDEPATPNNTDRSAAE